MNFRISDIVSLILSIFFYWDIKEVWTLSYCSKTLNHTDSYLFPGKLRLRTLWMESSKLVILHVSFAPRLWLGWKWVSKVSANLTNTEIQTAGQGRQVVQGESWFMGPYTVIIPWYSFICWSAQTAHIKRHCFWFIITAANGRKH